MADLQKLVLLHSNDLHGDFLSKDREERMIGGMSMLSGYVSLVRETEERVLYAIAGDMLQGSLIDTEFKGISTMEIMNYLAPDVACAGNHEVDYGLPHLLFLEKLANFPIITANLYIKNQSTRLLSPYKLFDVQGVRVLFIGILTEAVMDSLRHDKYIGTFVDIKDASTEIGKICNAYQTTDVDLTVILTHIGYEKDLELAELILPEWGVDIIIGGHSHTIIEKPAEVNNILIAQAGTGTEQIGRFDLIVNKDTNSIHDFTWECVSIDEEHCPRDYELESIIQRYKSQLDVKYEQILTRLARKHTHPSRNQETDLGNLFADICAETLKLDLMMLGSGAIRKTELGPTVKVADLYAVFPFSEPIHRVLMKGEQIIAAFIKILDPANLYNGSEHYQVNRGVEIIYDHLLQVVVSFKINHQPIDEKTLYKVGLSSYHYNNMDRFLGISHEEIMANGKPIMVTTSQTDIIEEYFMMHHNIKAKVEGRIQRVNQDES